MKETAAITLPRRSLIHRCLPAPDRCALRAALAIGILGLFVLSPAAIGHPRHHALLPVRHARKSPPVPANTVRPTDEEGAASADATPDTAVPALPSGKPDIKAPCAILIDAVSGQVLYEKNADARRPMASTTKIMTALLFCESVKDDDVIQASDYASRIRDSSLHLKKGERVSGHDLLRAILMRSANDACVAAAEHVSGSEQAFVAKMNQRAADLGAINTHFTNPHGLHNRAHYTSARDLALIARAAIKEPRINEVVRCEKCRIKRSMDKRDVTMRNHSHFLGHFPGADGIKTGWTIPAGHCYVGAATQNGWRLISVVLKSPDYVSETARLMKYGFGKFEPHTAVKAGESRGVCPVQNGNAPEVAVTAQQTVQIVTLKGETPTFEYRPALPSVAAPIRAGQPIGTLEVWRDGRRIGATPLVAATDVTAHVAALGGLSASRGMGRFWPGATIFGFGLVSLVYGKRIRKRAAALAKGARRRRSRLAESLRESNRRG